jgi:putative oxygen-independent coproporphyrinogen III oxidase
MKQALPPLSLYIHIPWCIRKCPYCDFNSHVADQEIPESDYVAALLQDLDQQLSAIEQRKLVSIFFGGGTPSLFSPAAIARILNYAEQKIGFAPTIEITLEANPGAAEQQQFSGYRAAGVNRLSIGVQSFDGRQLHKLGRVHNADEAISAITAAQHAGFDNYNIDLMHGLPDQSPANALADLQQAIDLSAKHISWYQLTIEPNTQFYTSPPTLPHDDQLADIQDHGEQLLSDHGFHNYEVSAYSQPGLAAQHNLNYWQFGDYLGIGAGAHSKLTSATGEISRHWQTRLPLDYLNPDKPFTAGSRRLNNDELPLEFAMNALRLSAGFSPALFSAHTRLPFQVLEPAIKQLIDRGLLERTELNIKPTRQGRRFLNDMLAVF